MQFINLILFVYLRHTLILGSTLSDDSNFEILDHPSNNNRGGSRTAATPKMEHFVIIVNGWKPLTIITKHSILDVAAALDQSLLLLEGWSKISKLGLFAFIIKAFCL